MFFKSLKKAFNLIVVFSLLFGQYTLPALAQEATPSADLNSPVVLETSPESTASAILPPFIAVEPTPASLPVPEWDNDSSGIATTHENVKIDHLYKAPQNDKVILKFNKLPSTPGKISIKEISVNSLGDSAALNPVTDKAYDISSTMENGTFEYTLTLPTPKINQVEVKASEDGQTFVTLGGVTAQTDTLTITGLNHFTIFVVTGTITERVCVAPPSGMTNWWTGDGHTNDITGGSNGTLINGTTYAAGKVSQSFSFDGNGDYVQMPSSVGNFGSSAFTVDFWMYSNNAGSTATYLVGRSHPNDGTGWDLRLHNSTIEVVGVNGWPAQYNFASDASAAPDAWHHIALSSTDSTVKLYIDGVLKGASPRSDISASPNPFRVGFTTNFGGSSFNGLLDEVEIFNRALSSDEVAAIYNAGSAGKCKTEENTTSLEAAPYVENEDAVVINEFVFDPSSGNEWIELYNNGSTDVSLSGWKLTDANSDSNDDLTLSGTIPANGLLVFEQSDQSGWLNDLSSNGDEETVTLKNSDGVAVSKVTYRKEANGTTINGQSSSLGNVTSGQSIGRVVDISGINWQVYSTPTKGWFNDAGGEGVAPLLSDIDSALSFLSEIESNIGELDNPSNTPSGDSGLYFEKTGMGKILFTNSLNLSNQNTVDILQSLGDQMELSEGHLKFDSQTASDMAATGAKLFIYGLNDLGYSSAPDVIVSDDDGNTISLDDPNYPIVGSIEYSGDNNGQIVFDASHFTQFDVEEAISGTISGYKFEDSNGNGVWDEDEDPLSDWTIYLSGASDDEVETDEDGYYIFEELLPGTYQVCENLEDGWMQTLPDDEFQCDDGTSGYQVELSSGEDIESRNFGNFRQGSISGQKFEDVNGDGSKGTSEAGLSGWGIFLDTNNNGVLDEEETSTVTDAGGNYQFSNLGAGTYKVREASQGGWVQTTSNPSDVTITSGTDQTNVDFGNFHRVIITGLKWKDLNANAVFDQSEPVLGGWNIDLNKVTPATDISTEIVQLQLTSQTATASGEFSLQVDRPGNYRVSEQSQAGFQKTYPTDSFFDIAVNVSGATITTDKNGHTIRFGNAPVQQVLGANFVATSGDASSSASIITLDSANISASADGGVSTVNLPAGTTITRTDGGNINLSDLSATSVLANNLSGLGSGLVVDGALQWGIPNIGLTFSQPINLSIFVGTSLNGQTLSVIRSTSGSSGWTSDGIVAPATCVVSAGFCSFQATKASYYATTHTSSSTSTSSSSSNGSDGGDGRSDGLGCATHDCSIRTFIQNQVLGVLTQPTVVGFAQGILGITSNEQTNGNVGIGEQGQVQGEATEGSQPSSSAPSEAKANNLPFNMKVVLVIVVLLLGGFGLFRLIIK